MIFFELYTLPNSTSGFDQIIVDTATNVPSFAPLILFFIFFVIMVGGIARQKMRTGTADYAMWAVTASLITFLATLILSTTTGIIRLDWLVIVIVITIFSGVWLFLDRRQSEV